MLLCYDVVFGGLWIGEGGLGKLVDVLWDVGEVFWWSINGWGLVLGDVNLDGNIDVLIGVNSDLDLILILEDDKFHMWPLLFINSFDDVEKNNWVCLMLW